MIYVDETALFPTLQPYNPDARISYADNPESYDGATGLLGLSEAPDSNIRSCFLQRENFYMSTDINAGGGLFVTSDNGITEPSGWSVERAGGLECSTLSVHGSTSTKQYAVIAGPLGAVIFNGGEPLKITQEIATSVTGIPLAWDQINWTAGQYMWVVNDLEKRVLVIGAPFNGSPFPNGAFMIDYKELQTSWQIATEGPIHTSYAGKVISWEPGRKTSPWNIRMNSAAMILRQDGKQHMWFGNGGLTGKVYEPIAGQYSDDGVAIDSFYATFMEPSELFAQQNPLLGVGRLLFTFLKVGVQGIGAFLVSALPLAITNVGPQYTLNLSPFPNEDLECPVRVAGERVAWKFGTNAAGSFWSMTKLMFRLRSHPMSRLRHIN